MNYKHCGAIVNVKTEGCDGLMDLPAPDPYLVALVGIGTMILLVAWLPLALSRLPISTPMIFIAAGFVLFALPISGVAPNPLHYPNATEKLSELAIIIALMGAGLKLDRPLTFRGWGLTWRLLAVTMTLSIAIVFALGWQVLGLSAAAALLLGSALAPTDPVLAADVQVGPPQSGEEDEVRFSLTSEAGLNDGLAFPFVNLAIAFAVAGSLSSELLAEWFAMDVAWKIAMGVGAGWAIGRGLAWVTFHVPHRVRFSSTGDGFVALGATLLSYSLTELAHGYGFLAVFIAAVTYRSGEREHEYYRALHDFADEAERLLIMVVLLLFGGAIAGDLLAPLTLADIAVALAIVLVVRPLAAWLALIGRPEPRRERALISFFGIRGVGSFYYLAFGLNAASFAEAPRLWALLGLIVLMSVFIHGITATPLMRAVQPGGEREATAEGEASRPVEPR